MPATSRQETLETRRVSRAGEGRHTQPQPGPQRWCVNPRGGASDPPPPPIPDPGARSPTAAPSLSYWASESTAGSQSLALTIWRERWRRLHTAAGSPSLALCLFGGIDESLPCPRLCHPEERPSRGSPHRSSCLGSCELVALEHFKNFIGIILLATQDPFHEHLLSSRDHVCAPCY